MLASKVFMFLAAAGVLAAAGFGLYKFSSYVDGKGMAAVPLRPESMRA